MRNSSTVSVPTSSPSRREARQLGRARRRPRRHRCRRRDDGLDQDARVVPVAGERERAAHAGHVADHDDRELRLERRARLEQQAERSATDPRPSRPRRSPPARRLGDPDLAASVVAADRRLEAERVAERRRAVRRIVGRAATSRQAATSAPRSPRRTGARRGGLGRLERERRPAGSGSAVLDRIGDHAGRRARARR